jgi:hypothetical protein
MCNFMQGKGLGMMGRNGNLVFFAEQYPKFNDFREDSFTTKHTKVTKF